MPQQDNGAWLENLAAQQERYVNVILLLGYGGFFALWVSTYGRMTSFQFGLCGGSMAVSLLLFIGFELFKAAMVGLAIGKASKRDAKGNRVNSDAEAIEIVKRRVDLVNRVWFWAFAPAVVTGLLSGAILVYCFVSQLVAG